MPPAEEPNHYRRLGVRPSASTEEIHTAYRELAGRFHPDRVGTAPEADRRLAERRMREINEAWTVLRDPHRRRTYDLGRTRRRSAATTGTPVGPVPTDRHPRTTEPIRHSAGFRTGILRNLTWVMMVFVLVGIVIATAYADRDRDRDRPAPTPTAEIGSCIDVETGPSTTVVDCDGPHEFRIVERVAGPHDCPRGTEARRLGTDGRFDCLAPG